jgi:hypothetical protein
VCWGDGVSVMRVACVHAVLEDGVPSGEELLYREGERRGAREDDSRNERMRVEFRVASG